MNASIPGAIQAALGHHRAGRLSQAQAIYRQVLQMNPDHPAALHLLGDIANKTGKSELAVELIRKAIGIKPNSSMYCDLGYAFRMQEKLDAAAESYRHALALKPDDANAHNSLGAVLYEQGKLDEAISHYNKVILLDPGYFEAMLNLGIALKAQGKADEAIGCYRKAIATKPDFAEAYNNLGSAVQDQGKPSEAIEYYRQALRLNPVYAEALNNLGAAMYGLRQYEEAIACYQKAMELSPNLADVYFNLGNAQARLRRYMDASANYKKTLSLKPDYGFALGRYLHNKMHCCDWQGIDDTVHELLGGIDAGKVVSAPFDMLPISSTPAQQKRCAEMCTRDKFPGIQTSCGVRGGYSHDKIRLGYFSADFHNHATAYLMAELIERHDRSRFEVFGFSYGASPDDDMRQRLRASFDHFHDVINQSDRDIAALARSLEIDIAVDLKGHTANARTGVFALRPAPIQVSYLGYPGTMGASYIDYLIADPTLIPVEYQQYYTEKIAYLPDTYQVNDSHRQISERKFTRDEVGLPAEGFVFCCFNNNYKITPAVFDIWMQLLKQVDGSVLWLFEGNAQAGQNLRHEAEKRGVAPERIVYARRMDLPDHLARHRLADLFLDTFYCNAHTTASDALWAGLPVLTCMSDAFAGRVAASLLNAIGLPELITYSHEEYKALALELATTPEKLASIKQLLARNRVTHPLFNTSLFTRHIEDAFIQMQGRYQESLVPDHIYVRVNK